MLDLSRFNPDQRRAVTTTEGPLVVVAGPGAGKTAVLAARAAFLVASGRAAPGEILALTFSNRAGRELRDRLAIVIGPAATDLWAGTFHAFALGLLRRWGERAGFDPARLTVYADAADRRAALLQAVRDLGRQLGGERPEALLDRISRAKARLWWPAQAAERDPDFGALYAAYQAVLARRNALDFDDFLLHAVQILGQHPDVLGALHDRYRYLLVDEAQDVAPAQEALLTQLAARHRNLCVVGDPLQAIYGWRGSDIRFLVDFRLAYPEAAVITLDQSYRASGTLLAAANALGALLAYGRRRLWTAGPPGEAIVVATLPAPDAEAAFITSELKRLLAAGVVASPVDCAVLYRTNAQVRELELACLAAGIPYRVRGDSALLSRAACRDVLAYLRLVHNPHDTLALGRVINTPPRRLAALARRIQAGEEWTLPRLAAEGNTVVHGAAAQRALAAFLALIEELRARRDGPPAALVRTLLARTGYRAWRAGRELRDGDTTGDPAGDPTGAPPRPDRGACGMVARERDDDDLEPGLPPPTPAGVRHDHAITAAPRHAGVIPADAPVGDAAAGSGAASADGPEAGGAEPLDLLLELAERSTATNLAGFLDDLALATDIERGGNGTAALTLSSIHQAKGLEFAVVFVAGVEEGLLPHARALSAHEPDAALAEELRLCYVAVTRAGDRLYLTGVRRRPGPGPGGMVTAAPSRFLHGLPAPLVARWDGRVPYAVAAPDAG